MKYTERNFTRTVHVINFKEPHFHYLPDGSCDYTKTVETDGVAYGVTAEQFPDYVKKYNLSPLSRIVSEEDKLLVIKEQALYRFALSSPDAHFADKEEAEEEEEV